MFLKNSLSCSRFGATDRRMRVKLVGFFIGFCCLTSSCTKNSVRLTDENETSQATIEVTERLVPDCGGHFDLCGFVDVSTGEIVIERQFEWAFDFSEGLAAVQKNGLFGYIRESGDFAIDPNFNLAGEFSSGRAEVIVEYSAGVIDTEGQYILEPNFKRAIPFGADTFIVADGQWSSMHRLVPSLLVEDFNPLVNNKGFGIYHLEEGWLSEDRFDVLFFDKPPDKYIWASEHKPREAGTKLYGLLSRNGTWKIEPRYRAVSRLINDVATVLDENNKLDLVNSTGEEIVLPEYDRVGSWTNGLLPVTESGRHGFISPDGKLIGGRLFDKIDRGSNNWRPRVFENSQWFVVEPNGELTEDERSGLAMLTCESGLSVEFTSNGLRFRDGGGQQVGAAEYDLRYYSAELCSRTFRLSIDGRYVGKMLPDGSISTNSNDVLQSPDTSIDAPPLMCEGGLIRTERMGKWGLRDADGVWIVAPEFDAITCYRRGFSWVPQFELKQWCAVDASGVVRIDLFCVDAIYPPDRSNSILEQSPTDADKYGSSVAKYRRYLRCLQDDRNDCATQATHNGQVYIDGE